MVRIFYGCKLSALDCASARQRGAGCVPSGRLGGRGPVRRSPGNPPRAARFRKPAKTAITSLFGVFLVARATTVHPGGHLSTPAVAPGPLGTTPAINVHRDALAVV